MDKMSDCQKVRDEIENMQNFASIKKIPVETIMNDVLQIFTTHDLTVHAALLILKKIKNEVKQQGHCMKVTNENLSGQFRRQSESGILVAEHRNNQTSPKNTDPSK